MSNYSPGPWQMGPYDYRFIFDSLGRNVAMLDFIKDGNETAANARLIAAAPVMFEALRRIVDSGWLVDTPTSFPNCPVETGNCWHGVSSHLQVDIADYFLRLTEEACYDRRNTKTVN